MFSCLEIANNSNIQLHKLHTVIMHYFCICIKFMYYYCIIYVSFRENFATTVPRYNCVHCVVMLNNNI